MASRLLQVQSLWKGAEWRVHQQVSYAFIIFYLLYLYIIPSLWMLFLITFNSCSHPDFIEVKYNSNINLSFFLSHHFFCRDGAPYCEKDYQIHFGVQCEACHQFITGKVLEVSKKSCLRLFHALPYVLLTWQLFWESFLVKILFCKTALHIF